MTATTYEAAAEAMAPVNHKQVFGAVIASTR